MRIAASLEKEAAEPISFIPKAHAQTLPTVVESKIERSEPPRVAVTKSDEERQQDRAAAPVRQAVSAQVPSLDGCIGETDGIDYKTLRLREMSCLWRGTVLEPYTVKLLAMLIVEDGTVTAERRHDCEGSRGCYAVGIQGHHICHRGTPLVSQAAGKPFKKFCYSGAMADFQKEYPGFSFDWRIQFAEYTRRMTDCIADDKSVNTCIQVWNSRESGRITKVENHQWIVKQALGI